MPTAVYRRRSLASPTRFIIAIAGEGTPADRYTGEGTHDQGAEEAAETEGAESEGVHGVPTGGDAKRSRAGKESHDKRSRGNDKPNGGRETRQKTGDG